MNKTHHQTCILSRLVVFLRHRTVSGSPGSSKLSPPIAAGAFEKNLDIREVSVIAIDSAIRSTRCVDSGLPSPTTHMYALSAVSVYTFTVAASR